MVASTPRPVIDRNSVAAATSPRSFAAATMARAKGCSLSDSTPAANRSTSSSLMPAPAAPTTTCSPLVSVPVLSNRKASTVRLCSSARRSLTRMPLRAASADEIDVVNGIARPSVGVRDDEHRDHPGDGLVPFPSEGPHHGGDRCSTSGHVEQQRRGPVSEHLGPRSAMPLPRPPAAGSPRGSSPPPPRRPAPGWRSPSTRCQPPPGHLPPWRPASTPR